MRGLNKRVKAEIKGWVKNMVKYHIITGNQLPTSRPNRSLVCLNLLKNFNLSIDDVKVHEKLCSKEAKEGQDIYEAMLPYFIYK